MPDLPPQPQRGVSPERIPASHADLVGPPHLAHVATLNPNGAPQVSPVWIVRDGDDLLFSTTEDRLKTRNLRRDPRLALSIHDEQDPFRYVEFRGDATVTRDANNAFLNSLAKAYLGVDKHPWTRPEDVRVVVRVKVTRTYVMG